MILNDKAIEKRTGMITPFVNTQVSELNGKKCASYGLSCCGYDIRLDDKVRYQIHTKNPYDIHNIYKLWGSEHIESEVIQIEPGETILACSVEYFKIPDDVFAVCYTKSTWARCGIFVNVTPLEPGWEGILTLEISNLGKVPILIKPMQGIAQIVFNKVNRPNKTYADRKGKYQNQSGVTVGKL